MMRLWAALFLLGFFGCSASTSSDDQIEGEKDKNEGDSTCSFDSIDTCFEVTLEVLDAGKRLFKLSWNEVEGVASFSLDLSKVSDCTEVDQENFGQIENTSVSLDLSSLEEVDYFACVKVSPTDGESSYKGTIHKLAFGTSQGGKFPKAKVSPNGGTFSTKLNLTISLSETREDLKEYRFTTTGQDIPDCSKGIPTNGSLKLAVIRDFDLKVVACGKNGEVSDQIEVSFTHDPSFKKGEWALYHTNGPVVRKSGNWATRNVSSGGKIPWRSEAAVFKAPSSSDVYIFGGRGAVEKGPFTNHEAGAYSADLWRYNSGAWTWASGPKTSNYNSFIVGTRVRLGSNRGAAVMREDDGDVVFFGGWMYISGALSLHNRLLTLLDSAGDFQNTYTNMFVPDPLTPLAGNLSGVYGTQGTPNGSNVIGSRAYAAAWSVPTGPTSSEEVWVFGGWGRDENGSSGRMNDTWVRGTDTSNAFTWIKGDKTRNQDGTWGSQGVSNGTNNPSAREAVAYWENGTELFMFGGFGYDSASSLGRLGDLWKFDVSAEEWVWLKGANTAGTTGTYGTKGVAAAGNTPPARQGAIAIEMGTDIYFYGGKSGGSEVLSDLWKFDGTNWTWVSGSQTPNSEAVYGTTGVANSANFPGGYQPAGGWADGTDLYFFGGNRYFKPTPSSSGSIFGVNELWKYDTVADNWTFVYGEGDSFFSDFGSWGTKGEAHEDNHPGPRLQASMWTDVNGLVYLFGGRGYDSDYSSDEYPSDLWRFDGENWAWIHGSSVDDRTGSYGAKGVGDAANTPPGRRLAAYATDKNGNFWMHGGTNSSGQFLADLWKFDGKTWTWVSGPNTNNQAGVYGTKHVYASANIPGSRAGHAMEFNSKGELVMFGGYGYDENAVANELDDLWIFDGKEWKYVSGSPTLDTSSNYGTKGVAAPTNTPNNRTTMAMAIDKDDNVWIFGGEGHRDSGTTITSSSPMADLWRWDGVQWTWVAGEKNNVAAGAYGTKGVADGANYPSGRIMTSNSMWVDKDGNVFIHAGYRAGGLEYNDLWRFDGTNWTWLEGDDDGSQTQFASGPKTFNALNYPGLNQSCMVRDNANQRVWKYSGWGTDSSDFRGDSTEMWVLPY